MINMSFLRIAVVLVVTLCYISLSMSALNEEQVFYLQNHSEHAEIKASTDKVIAIQIEGNPTTGYLWLLEETAGLNDHLEPIGLTKNNKTEGNFLSTEFYSSNSQEGLAGAPGIFTFKFAPKRNFTGSKEIKLKFKYMRPWDSTDGPSDFEVDVILSQSNLEVLESHVIDIDTASVSQYMISGIFAVLGALVL
mmetsp:Transcript_6362/g.6618  ORF Transcript_6362/g.6618 Transcript_6362/m.6618 type:complete len:193 (-) Transcript_6362:50-628(-)